MKTEVSIIDLFKELPIEELNAEAERLKVDYKAKKIHAMTLFALLAQGYLMTDKLSQRYVCKEAKLLTLKELFNLDVYTGHLSHSSLSERLSKIQPEFFEKAYKTLYSKALVEFGFAPLVKSNIVRIDTTYVAETANKLLEGIRTGVNNRYGGERRQIKYGMAYDGFGVLVSDIFTNQAQSSDEVALASVVKDAIRCNDGKREVYLFDRGTSSFDNLKEIDELSNESGSFFVARLKLNRSMDVIKRNNVPPEGNRDNEFEIVQDCEVHLKNSKTSKWDESTEFRVIKVTFSKPRPKSPGAMSHQRKYSEDMLLITNDFKSPALAIAQEYKCRWSIEVFFKFLKQNLSFSHLLSVNTNGIKVMLYMTLIMGLLIKIFELRSGLGPKMAILEMQIQISNYLFLHESKNKDCNINSIARSSLKGESS